MPWHFILFYCDECTALHHFWKKENVRLVTIKILLCNVDIIDHPLFEFSHNFDGRFLGGAKCLAMPHYRVHSRPLFGLLEPPTRCHKLLNWFLQRCFLTCIFHDGVIKYSGCLFANCGPVTVSPTQSFSFIQASNNLFISSFTADLSSKWQNHL